MQRSLWRIAVLGWGSLLWDRRKEFDDQHEPWQFDGPDLKLEFSRISASRGGALTLVIDSKNGQSCRSAYAISRRADPDDAIADLRCREGTLMRHVGFYFSDGSRRGLSDIPETVPPWAEIHDFDAVVWTGLPSNFEKETGEVFSVANAIKHLRSLDGGRKESAAEYISRALALVDTPLRRALKTEQWFAGFTDTKITELKRMVTAAREEFDMAVTYHEVWKPASYDRDLHSRMGQSYASQAFLVVRMALRREMVLALMRLWDRNKQAVRMSLIVATIRRTAVIDALATQRATRRSNWPGVFEQMHADLQAKANKVIELTNKYSEGGSHSAILEELLRLRDERLAHRQIEPSTVEGADNFDEAIEEFYQDHANIIEELLSLANAMAYDPLETAKVYERYAAEFWAGVRGERTEGHPHFRPRR